MRSQSAASPKVAYFLYMYILCTPTLAHEYIMSLNGQFYDDDFTIHLAKPRNKFAILMMENKNKGIIKHINQVKLILAKQSERKYVKILGHQIQ